MHLSLYCNILYYSRYPQGGLGRFGGSTPSRLSSPGEAPPRRRDVPEFLDLGFVIVWILTKWTGRMNGAWGVGAVPLRCCLFDSSSPRLRHTSTRSAGVRRIGELARTRGSRTEREVWCAGVLRAPTTTTTTTTTTTLARRDLHRVGAALVLPHAVAQDVQEAEVRDEYDQADDCIDAGLHETDCRLILVSAMSWGRRDTNLPRGGSAFRFLASGVPLPRACGGVGA